MTVLEGHVTTSYVVMCILFFTACVCVFSSLALKLVLYELCYLFFLTVDNRRENIKFSWMVFKVWGTRKLHRVKRKLATWTLHRLVLDINTLIISEDNNEMEFSWQPFASKPCLNYLFFSFFQPSNQDQPGPFPWDSMDQHFLWWFLGHSSDPQRQPQVLPSTLHTLFPP